MCSLLFHFSFLADLKVRFEPFLVQYVARYSMCSLLFHFSFLADLKVRFEPFLVQYVARYSMCSLLFHFSFLADLKVRFEQPSYTVIENEGPLEVCGVLSNPASQTLVIRGIAQESSPPDAKGMYVLKQLLL